jgi:Brp/Blh family beta-carotene 15,15'-monooxygenase
MLYSYLIVSAIIIAKWAFPSVTTMILPIPLLIGMLGLGISHGACDHKIIPIIKPGYQPTNWVHMARYWLSFLICYLGLAAVVIGLWWWVPTVAVAAFFLLTVWHWGSADAPHTDSKSQWVLHSVLRGIFLFAVPGVSWPGATADVVNGLLTFAGSTPVSDTLFTQSIIGLWIGLGVGMPILWLRYLRQHHADRVIIDILEIGLLGVLLTVLPPVFSSGVYFVFWHSLQHVRRLNYVMGYEEGHASHQSWLKACKFFALRAWPLLLVSVLALLGLYGWWAGHAPLATFWLPLALVCASVVTLPHALLVTLVMDTNSRRRSSQITSISSSEELLPTYSKVA